MNIYLHVEISARELDSKLVLAILAASRGHEVIVFEATDKPGGQINLITRSTKRKDMIGIVDWRVQMCEKNNVKIFS